MSPNEAAQKLLSSLSLPRSAATVLPWHENGNVVMHVLIDVGFAGQSSIPENFDGYDVVVEIRQPAIAYHRH